MLRSRRRSHKQVATELGRYRLLQGRLVAEPLASAAYRCRRADRDGPRNNEYARTARTSIRKRSTAPTIGTTATHVSSRTRASPRSPSRLSTPIIDTPRRHRHEDELSDRRARAGAQGTAEPIEGLYAIGNTASCVMGRSTRAPGGRSDRASDVWIRRGVARSAGRRSARARIAPRIRLHAPFDFTDARSSSRAAPAASGAPPPRAFREAGADVLMTGTRAASKPTTPIRRTTSNSALQLERPESIELLPPRSLSAVDVLVNNAGHTMPQATFTDAVQVNLLGGARPQPPPARTARGKSLAWRGQRCEPGLDDVVLWQPVVSRLRRGKGSDRAADTGRWRPAGRSRGNPRQCRRTGLRC